MSQPAGQTVQARAEVVGSLLRPEWLKDAYAHFERGEIGGGELTEFQDRAVMDAIRLYEDTGIDVITDGEMRRKAWFDPLTDSLSGYTTEVSAPVPFSRGAGQAADAPPVLPVPTRRLGLRHNLPLEEVTFVREHSGKPVKATMPGMTYASVLYVPGQSDVAYPDRDAYMADALGLMREIVRQLADAGVLYIQLDSPRYTHMVSEQGRANLERVGLDTQTWLTDMIAMDNALMEGFDEVTFAVHLCRGNHRSMWSVEGAYDAIAEQLFTTLNVRRILAEYDSPRAGSFAPLRFVPIDKTVVLGLITTKEPELEDDAEIRSRIDEAAGIMPLDRLALSPQCGFASTLPGNKVTEADQRAKLELVSRVARAVWG
jgi:5-methyltetrahydropteroyltriglutamate--homocysteine methyltransferase